MKPSLLIRADAAPRMGTGHVMRCLALAQAARGAGLDVRMACRLGGVDWLGERLQRENIPLLRLPGEPPAAEAPENLLRQLRGASLPVAVPGEAPAWVVLDGYHFGPDCQQAVMGAGYGLLVIDDYAHLPEYHCDLLLNQNVGADAHAYAGSIGQMLLGPAYALLRREFPDARPAALRRKKPAQPQNILITLGGGNFPEYLESMAAALTGPALEGRTVRVVMGAMDAGRVRAAFAESPARLELLPRVDDMAALLLDTDLCVTAGGSTCWELCCLGVPFMTVEVAENQHEVCHWLARNGIAPRFSPDALWRLLTGPETARARAAAMRLIDGTGAADVVRRLQNTAPRRSQERNIGTGSSAAPAEKRP